MSTHPPLYPLRFEPILQYRLWGGRHLEEWTGVKLPGTGPIGEAWLLSDRDDFPSHVADGPLKGKTIASLIEQSPELMLGELISRFKRFPLLLKFLDVQKMLSVQVHPRDDQTALIPKGDTGKTEAWVVLEAQSGGRVYAGLKAGTTPDTLRTLSNQTADDYLPSFTPVAGQGILIEAGTIHSLGDGVVVFEVQENSDVTFRLYDWDHVDPKTNKKRDLQIDKALACIDFAQGTVTPVVPVPETAEPIMRERLFDSPHFRMWRIQAAVPFTLGSSRTPHVLVCIDGAGCVQFGGAAFEMTKGTVILLPAALGVCCFQPEHNVTMLDITVPEI